MSSQGRSADSVEERPFAVLFNKISKNATWGSPLEGQLLTLVDAMISDEKQRDAFKSLVRNTVRGAYNDINQTLGMLVNHFTEAYEDEKIEYTTLHVFPGKDKDVKKLRKAGVGSTTSPMVVNLFKKIK